MDHRQLGEERIRPLRGTLADHQQHREAPLRRTTRGIRSQLTTPHTSLLIT